MSITGVAFHRYRVPFRVPFLSSHGREQQREGVLIRLTTRDGLMGFGEAAELTSFGTAPVGRIEATLRDLGTAAHGETVETALEQLTDSINEPGLSPARFALETALLDIQSRRNELPLSRYLDANASTSVRLNATISDMNPEGAARAANYAVLAGYRAVKTKVGVLTDPDQEAQRIAAIRDSIGPETELRLDANGAWSIEQAIEMAAVLEPYDIAYFEQPLSADDIAGMADLRSKIPIPIAADEAATSRDRIEALVASEAVDAIIIKPAISGGIRAARELISLATSAGVRVIVTTAMETGVAITAALHLAATLPQPVPACGLATGALLDADLLVTSPKIKNGSMLVPSQPGLGVEPASVLWDEVLA